MVGKDVASNVLYVDQDRDSKWMLSNRLRSETAHWIAGCRRRGASNAPPRLVPTAR